MMFEMPFKELRKQLIHFKLISLQNGSHLLKEA